MSESRPSNGTPPVASSARPARAKTANRSPATRRYRWDAENRLEAALDSVTGDTHYQRDHQGQLIKENDTDYHYDLGGNRLPDGGKVERDRLVETKTDKRQYDTLGAEIRVTGKTTGLSDSQTRQFDAEGQLIEVRKPGIHVSYGYDALGRRAWRKSEAGTTTYLWHNDVLLGEQTPDGQWQWYLRDPNTDEPLVTLINGQPHYYELDHRMMPIRLWDQSGDMVWQDNANAWGLCQPEMPKGHIHQPIRLPGQFEDELTGIVQNRFREYEPVTGGYLTADPLGIKGGLNPYRYTQNPVDFIDPRGLSFELVVTPEGVYSRPEMAGVGEGVATLAEIPEATGIIAPLEDNYFRDSFSGQVSNFLVGDLATNVLDLWRSTFGDERYIGINPLTNEHQGYTNRTERVFAILPIPAAKTGKAASNVAKILPNNPANRALHARYTDGLRAAMEKPAVSDPGLAKLVNQLYRPNASVGSGSTAAAVRHELATGQPVGNAFHSQKAEDSIVALQRWLDKNPAARSGDRAAAENIIRDLSNALRGH